MNWPRALRGIAAPALMPICVFLWKYKFLIYYIVWEICLAVCTRARMLLHRRRRCPPIRSRKTMVLNINWFPCNHFLFSISQTYIFCIRALCRLDAIHSEAEQQSGSQRRRRQATIHIELTYSRQTIRHRISFVDLILKCVSNTLMVCVVRTENHVACQRSDSMLKIEILSQNPFFSLIISRCCLV